MHLARISLLTTLFLTLTACGGGGGGSPASPLVQADAGQVNAGQCDVAAAHLSPQQDSEQPLGASVSQKKVQLSIAMNRDEFMQESLRESDESDLQEPTGSTEQAEHAEQTERLESESNPVDSAAIGAHVNTPGPQLPQATDPQDQSPNPVIKSGTYLAATMKDICLTPDGKVDGSKAGEITRTLNTTNVLPTRGGEQVYNWTVPQDMTLEEIERISEEDSCLSMLADESLAYPSSIPDDPRYEEEGHLKFMEANSAYEKFYGSSGINKTSVIAIVDTGVDMKHEDFQGMFWTNRDEIPNNGRDDDKNGYVDDVNGYNFASRKGNPHFETRRGLYHHGTHVAGLAAARGFNGKGVTGVMGYGARIMALNVFGKSTGAFASNTANAIRYAADNGAHVINLSIGGLSHSAAYEAALRYAVNKGVVVVAAAGNESRTLGPSYFLTPGAYGRELSGMITVGSVDASDGTSSTFTNYSPTYVELAAPGAEDSSRYVGVLSTMPDNKYARIQGTSMSSPVAAGAAGLASAIVRSRGYAAPPSQVEKILTESALKNSRLGSKVKNGSVLNLQSMASYIDQNFPATGPANLLTGDKRLPEVKNEDRSASETNVATNCP